MYGWTVSVSVRERVRPCSKNKFAKFLKWQMLLKLVPCLSVLQIACDKVCQWYCSFSVTGYDSVLKPILLYLSSIRSQTVPSPRESQTTILRVGDTMRIWLPFQLAILLVAISYQGKTPRPVNTLT